MSAIKILQKGAFKMQEGANGSYHPWGGDGVSDLTAGNNAIPWVGFPKNKTVSYVEDNSIVEEGFKPTPRKTNEYVETNLSTYSRFQGLNHLNYWSFGFENSIVEVNCFVLSGVSTEPAAGAVYTEGGDDFTFLRKEVSNAGTYYIFRNDDDSAVSGTGTLTKSSGTGDASLTYTAVSSKMYEHLYELDAHERHAANFRTAEQITGYTSGDKKCRRATLGCKVGNVDFRYVDAMCKGFNFSSSPNEQINRDFQFCAYDEERGDYSSDSWAYDSDFAGSDNILLHHQNKVSIGSNLAGLTAYAVTGWDLNVEIPLQVLSTTESGTHIAEPYFEGVYNVNCNISIARYSIDSFQDDRDAWSNVIAHFMSNYGYFMQELCIQKAKIINAGPDEADVPTEPLTLRPFKGDWSDWGDWFHGNSMIQNGPVVLRVRDDSPVNKMFEY